MRAIRKVLPEIDLEAETIPAEILNQLKVSKEEFFCALREMEPSALREVLVESPNVHWDDIGGLDDVKQALAVASSEVADLSGEAQLILFASVGA